MLGGIVVMRRHSLLERRGSRRIFGRWSLVGWMGDELFRRIGWLGGGGFESRECRVLWTCLFLLIRLSSHQCCVAEGGWKLGRQW